MMFKSTSIACTCQFHRKMSKECLPGKIYLPQINGLKPPKSAQNSLSSGLACRSWRMEKPHNFLLLIELVNTLVGNRQDWFCKQWIPEAQVWLTHLLDLGTPDRILSKPLKQQLQEKGYTGSTLYSKPSN